MFALLSSQHASKRHFCPFSDWGTETHSAHHLVCVRGARHKRADDGTVSCSAKPVHYSTLATLRNRVCLVKGTFSVSLLRPHMDSGVLADEDL